MEFKADSTEQIYVRPKADTPREVLEELSLEVVFIPPMTGIGIDEPVFQEPKIRQLLGLGRAGEVLRNLLVAANDDDVAWDALQESIVKLFDCALLPPDTSGPHIRAEYKPTNAGDSARACMDIAAAGSGFQQVLMLLAFIHTRPGAVLLLDEPDAHLHMILQNTIHHELKMAAAKHGSQLVIATHSEVIMDAVDPREMYVMFDEPRAIADSGESSQRVSSLRVLSNNEVMQAKSVRGVLYVEDSTDISILRAWATQLKHPAEKLLATGVLVKSTVIRTRDGGVNDARIQAHDHFVALRTVRDDLPGVELLDGNGHSNAQEGWNSPAGLLSLRWSRYEIESYLLHPEALVRFVEKTVGVGASGPQIESMLAYWHDNFPPVFSADPLGDHEFLNAMKARTKLLPQLLKAAGIDDLLYARYQEIAHLMLPQEIHTEVVGKLDSIFEAFEGQN